MTSDPPDVAAPGCFRVRWSPGCDLLGEALLQWNPLGLPYDGGPGGDEEEVLFLRPADLPAQLGPRQAVVLVLDEAGGLPGEPTAIGLHGVVGVDCDAARLEPIARQALHGLLVARANDAAGHLRQRIHGLSDSLELADLFRLAREALDEISIQRDGLSLHLAPVGGGAIHGLYCDALAVPREYSMDDEDIVRRLSDWMRSGRPVYRSDLQTDDPYGESALLSGYYGHPVRSVLDVPFSHGLLGLNHRLPDAFPPPVLEAVARVADALSEGCARLDELETARAEGRRFRALIDSSPDAILLYSPAGLCTLASDSVTRYGVVPAQVVGSCWLQQACRHEDRPALVRLLDGAGPERLGTILWGDGRWHHVEITAAHAPGEVQLVLRDTTTQVRRSRERLLSLVVEHMKAHVLESSATPVLQSKLHDIRQQLHGLGCETRRLCLSLLDGEAYRQICLPGHGHGGDRIEPTHPEWPQLQRLRERGGVVSRTRRAVSAEDPTTERLLRVPFEHGVLEMEARAEAIVAELLTPALKQLVGYLDEALRREQASSERTHLLRHLARLDRAVEQNPVAVMITDLEGHIEYVNPAMTELTGYTEAELLGETPRLLHSGEHDEEYYAAFWETIQMGEVWRGQFHNRRKDGSLYWERAVVSRILGPDGEPQGYVATKEDVSRAVRRGEEDRAIAAVRESVWSLREGDSFDTIMRGMGRALAAIGIRVQVFSIYLAEATDRGTFHFGRIVGHEVELLPHCPASARAAQVLRSLVEAGEIVCRQDLHADDPLDERAEIESKWGSTRTVVDIPFEFGTLCVTSGEPEAFSSRDLAFLRRLGVVIGEGLQRLADLRTLRQSNESLTAEIRQRTETEQALLRSSRLIALGEMSAGMAHELNQPLTVISALAEGLGLRLESGQEVTTERSLAWAQDILGQVERMRHVIEHLRLFSRDRSPELEEAVDLTAVVDAALSMCATQLRAHGVELSVDIDEGIPPVCGDAYALEEVLLNLLSNARDALEGREGARVRLRVAAVDGGVEVEVADNGPGISAENQVRLFDPFFTTKDPDRGTGLGLSIAYAIARQHRGTLRCASTLGAGATFRLHLPA